MSRPTRDNEEKAIIPVEEQFGEGEASIEQGIREGHARLNQFGRSGAGGFDEEKGRIRDLDILSAGNGQGTRQSAGAPQAASKVVSDIGKAVIRQAEEMVGLNTKVKAAADVLKSLGNSQDLLGDLGNELLVMMGSQVTASQIGKAALDELGNVMLSYMTESSDSTSRLGGLLSGSIDTVAEIGRDMRNFITESRQGQEESNRSMLDFMEEMRQDTFAVARDMIQPGSAIISAMDMMGLGDDEVKHAESGETIASDFISELVASGVSDVDAKATANIIDTDSSGGISKKELMKYDASTDTVANRAIRDPAFRARLVKKPKFSSIYAPSRGDGTNQTKWVDMAMAQNAESVNQNNVAFSQS
jgi:hypothetical protein